MADEWTTATTSTAECESILNPVHPLDFPAEIDPNSQVTSDELTDPKSLPDGVPVEEIDVVFVDGTDQLIPTISVIPIENEMTVSTEGTDDASGTRRSDRKRKQVRSFSPVVDSKKQKKKRKGRAVSSGKQEPGVKLVKIRPYDKGPDGKPFCCFTCHSSYVCNPITRRNKYGIPSKHAPVPRQSTDPVTGETILLCNTCSAAIDKPEKKPKKPRSTPEDKKNYLEEAKNFALSLVEGLNDPDAERLSCPYFKDKGCGCMQKYIIGNGEMEASRERASALLVLLKEAKKLSSEKSYDTSDIIVKRDGSVRRFSKIGLGNGHKKSKRFEEFVLLNRTKLRDEYKFCERATQKVLVYSNNFLHKQLKTEQTRSRIVSTKGRRPLGLLISIPELPKEKCCQENCSLMAITHPRLLEEWRSRASESQQEARKVLAEMLTPCGGNRMNCYKFITMVTGCSNSTIWKVNEQMRRTQGLRDPPKHGLVEYWQKHPKRKKKAASQESQSQSQPPPEPTTQAVQVLPAYSQDHTTAQTLLQHFANGAEGTLVTLSIEDDNPVATSIQIEQQKQQLAHLKKQVQQQQLQLQQQQALLQQQLLQQQQQQQGQIVNIQNLVVSGQDPTLQSSSVDTERVRVIGLPFVGTTANQNTNRTVTVTVPQQQQQQLQQITVPPNGNVAVMNQGASSATTQTVVTQLSDYLTISPNINLALLQQITDETVPQNQTSMQNIGGVNYTTVYIQPQQSNTNIAQQIIATNQTQDNTTTSGDSANEDEEPLLSQQPEENITIEHDSGGVPCENGTSVQLSSEIVQLLAQQGIQVGNLAKT